jgi:DNA (cytosine-5)-methyltransferase 1
VRVLDLFSGIGGFSLGLERAGMETVAFCEFDKKAQLVLKKHWPDVPIYDDVRELTYDKLKEDGIVVPLSTSDGLHPQEQGGIPQDKRQTTAGEDALQVGRHSAPNGRTGGNNEKQFEGQSIDLICGGFPCQPFSQAGKRKGEEDDRHLWPEYFRLIQEIRPRWVIGENVAGLISMGLDQVLSDLASASYSHQSLVIPACAVNAPHRRDRVWIIARRNAMGNSEYNGSSTTKESRSPSSVSNNSPQGENKTFQSKGTSGRSNIENVAHSISDSKGSSYRKGVYEESNGEQNNGNEIRDDSGNSGKALAHANKERIQGRKETRNIRSGGENGHKLASGQSKCGLGNNWAVEPDVGRVAHGIPNRVDRLKQLGNAVVPQVVEEIGRAIMEVERLSER